MNSSNEIHVKNLVVEHVTVSGAFRALDCAELSIDGGTSLAIMGPSGCGKSTLLGVIAGLAVPDNGSIHIGNTELSALSESERVAFRKKTIGVVYQADNLLPFLTVFENIQLQLTLCGDNDDVEERIQNVLEQLGIGDLAKRLPDQLSGGQRQRAAIARAIIHRPDVILADEPTGSLDDYNAAQVVELLLDAQRQLDSTLVVVTHDPSVANHMERLILLDKGSIVRNDTGGV